MAGVTSYFIIGDFTYKTKKKYKVLFKSFPNLPQTAMDVKCRGRRRRRKMYNTFNSYRIILMLRVRQEQEQPPSDINTNHRNLWGQPKCRCIFIRHNLLIFVVYNYNNNVFFYLMESFDIVQCENLSKPKPNFPSFLLCLVQSVHRQRQETTPYRSVPTARTRRRLR